MNDKQRDAILLHCLTGINLALAKLGTMGQTSEYLSDIHKYLKDSEELLDNTENNE